MASVTRCILCKRIAEKELLNRGIETLKVEDKQVEEHIVVEPVEEQIEETKMPPLLTLLKNPRLRKLNRLKKFKFMNLKDQKISKSSNKLNHSIMLNPKSSFNRFTRFR